MPLTPTEVQAVAAATAAKMLFMSLHTGNPGTTGASEATGGAPAYGRQSTVMTATGGVGTTTQETFAVPAGTYTHFGLWSAATGGTFLAGDALAAPQTVTAQGQVAVAVTLHVSGAGMIGLNGATGLWMGPVADLPPTPRDPTVLYVVTGGVTPGTAPTITTTSLGTLTVSSAVNQTLAATGSTPITYTVTTGSLPAGLSLTSGGVLSGTPITSGAYSFTVTATNSTGTDTQAYSGTVSAATPVGSFSIFGTAAPGTTNTIYADGGGSLRMGNRFYTSEATSIRVLGARLWNPVSSDATFLNADITVDAYTNDWTGQSVTWNTTVATTVRQTKTHTATRIADAWTDIVFDTPFTLPPIAAGSGTLDLLSLVIQFAGGQYYVISTGGGAGTTPINSTGNPGTYLAEFASVGIGINSMAPGDSVNTHYGLDLLFEVL